MDAFIHEFMSLQKRVHVHEKMHESWNPWNYDPTNMSILTNPLNLMPMKYNDFTVFVYSYIIGYVISWKKKLMVNCLTVYGHLV